MNLFTLLSKHPGSTFIISLLLAVPTSLGYTLWLNPEICLKRKVIKLKRSWAEEMRRQTPTITIISGGSSSLFQIDTDLLHREFGSHVCNTGLAAGMDLDGTVAFSSTYLENGDRLLLMTEPPLLARGGGKLTALAAQTMLINGHWEKAFTSEKLREFHLTDLLLRCRPGLTHCTAMWGKLVTGRALYRYKIEDFGRDGFASTPVRRPIEHPSTDAIQYKLTEAGRVFLRQLKGWADQRGIEVVYLLPVFYVPSPQLEAQREANRRFLKEINEIIPTWIDSYLGCSSDPADFADTPLHMTKSAAQERTRVLGKTYGKELRAGNPAWKLPNNAERN